MRALRTAYDIACLIAALLALGAAVWLESVFALPGGLRSAIAAAIVAGGAGFVIATTARDLLSGRG